MALDPEVIKYVDDSIAEEVAFSKKKVGDTPTDMQQLTPKGYVDGQISSVYASVVAIIPSVSAGFPGIFGSGTDGSRTINGITSTMGSDMYFSNLTVSGSGVLITNGYRLYVNSVLTITSSGTIKWNGNNGQNGSLLGTTQGGGRGGSVLVGVTVGNNTAGGAGGIGGDGKVAPVNTNGLQGIAGSTAGTVSVSIGSSDFTRYSGAGGASGPAGAKQGADPSASIQGGNISAALNKPSNIVYAINLFDNTPTFANQNGSAGGSGGSGGSQCAVDGNITSGYVSGAGGGGGSGGGMVAVYANSINNSVTAGIQALGGNGGNGSDALTGNPGAAVGVGAAGGGGGGAGGAGGVIVLVYHSLTNTGTFSVTGGTGGSPGTSTVPVGNGGSGIPSAVGGQSGADGQIWQIQV